MILLFCRNIHCLKYFFCVWWQNFVFISNSNAHKICTLSIRSVSFLSALIHLIWMLKFVPFAQFQVDHRFYPVTSIFVYLVSISKPMLYRILFFFLFSRIAFYLCVYICSNLYLLHSTKCVIVSSQLRLLILSGFTIRIFYHFCIFLNFNFHSNKHVLVCPYQWLFPSSNFLCITELRSFQLQSVLSLIVFMELFFFTYLASFEVFSSSKTAALFNESPTSCDFLLRFQARQSWAWVQSYSAACSLPTWRTGFFFSYLLFSCFTINNKWRTIYSSVYARCLKLRNRA